MSFVYTIDNSVLVCPEDSIIIVIIFIDICKWIFCWRIVLGWLIVFCSHWVAVVKFFCSIVVISDMSGEIVFTSEEVVVGGFTGIPCGIEVIIIVIHPGDIPSVSTSVALTGNNPCVYACFKSHAVKKDGIALADGRFIDQGSIGCIF